MGNLDDSAMYRIFRRHQTSPATSSSVGQYWCSAGDNRRLKNMIGLILDFLGYSGFTPPSIEVLLQSTAAARASEPSSLTWYTTMPIPNALEASMSAYRQRLGSKCTW